jgi:nucleotide-binding universal stress UspA family protein
MWNSHRLSHQNAAWGREDACSGSSMNPVNSPSWSRRGSSPDESSGPADTAVHMRGQPESASTKDRAASIALNTVRGVAHAPFKRILLLYHGSHGAEKSLHLGLDVARRFKARLLIVGVTPLPCGSDLSELQAIIEGMRVRLSRKFYEIRLNAMNEGFWVETMLALGDPAELIVRNAERFRASLIIVEHAGVSVRSDTGARSLPEAVCKRAPCPVLVARHS